MATRDSSNSPAAVATGKPTATPYFDLPNPLTLAWQQATRQALTSRPGLTLLRSEITGYAVELHYDVDSVTRPGRQHRVVTSADADGVHVCCSCEQARYRNQPCRHAAAVLLTEGWLTPDDIPAPVPSLLDLFAREDG